MDERLATTPIVLLRTEDSPFADYLAEILYTEGLPWFETVDSWSEAQAAGVLLLPAGAAVDVGELRAWIEEGGAAVVIRPPADTYELAGLRPAGGSASELPLHLEPPFDAGAARAHGEVDLCELAPGSEAKVLAHVLHDGQRYPAVASARCGRGHVAVFAYDLPHSVAFTRQGSPAWIDGRGTDFGSNTFRPADLFVRGRGAETWLDFPSAGAPLADMQQRLLAHLIVSLSPMPLPRVWYLPHAARTVLTILGDSDSADPEVVSEQFDDVAAAGGCMSAFLIDHTVDRADAETVARWRAAGHEVTVHPDYGLHGDKSAPDRETMLLTLRTLIDRFRSRFGFMPRTIRNHSISWVPFAEQPKIERSLGIRLNSSYVYSSAFAKPPYGGSLVGYLNGSGQPQKFVDEHGNVFDIYQLGVQVCDEMLKSQYVEVDANAAWRETKKFIDANISRWHSYVGLSFHPITYHSNPDAKRWLRDCILPYANEHGLPIWSTEMILDFADARRGCRMESVEWGDGQFACEFHAPSTEAGLTLMMPAQAQGRKLTKLTVSGAQPPECNTELAAGSWRLAVVERERSEIVAHYG